MSLPLVFHRDVEGEVDEAYHWYEGRRVWHLENRARNLAKGLSKFETLEEPDKDKLKECLLASSERLETSIEQVVAGSAKRSHFKKGIIAEVDYFIAHESHQRGKHPADSGAVRAPAGSGYPVCDLELWQDLRG